MAGRIRTVKPEWLEDEKMVFASSDARVLSVGLILLADDHGNGRGNPTWLQAQIFPGMKDPREFFLASRELIRMGFVTFYEASGQTYFAILNWTKHQRVDKPSKPRVPGPREGKPIKNIEETAPSRDPRETLLTTSRDPRGILAPDHDPDHDPDLEAADAANADPRPDVVADTVRPEPTSKQQQQKMIDEESKIPEACRRDEPSSSHQPEPGKQIQLYPRNLDDALSWPIQKRARACIDHPQALAWVEPHKWPELRSLAERFATAAKWSAPRLVRANAKGVDQLVELLAAFSSEELDQAIEGAKTDTLLPRLKARFAGLSETVVSQLIAPSSDESEGMGW